jgi:putative copper resistance protein D
VVHPAAAALAPFRGAWLSSWSVAWVVNVLMLAATVGYAALTWRHFQRTGERRIGSSVSWLAAMLALVIACNSSVAVYSDTLFSVHMIQHLTLIMVVPPLLIWAGPWQLVPTRHGEATAADALQASRLWRMASSPAFSVPLYVVAVVATHLTAFQQLAIIYPVVRLAENVLYLVSGYLLFAPLVTAGKGHQRIPDLIRFVILIAAMGADTLTGIALMLTSTVLAPGYAAAHPGWGPDALTDQTIAGGLMWVVGDGIMMLIMIVIGVIWGTRHQDSGLGDWLDNIRRRELLGDQWDPAQQDPDVDLDQAVLDAYNERLALLHRQSQQEGNGYR